MAALVAELELGVVGGDAGRQVFFSQMRAMMQLRPQRSLPKSKPCAPAGRHHDVVAGEQAAVGPQLDARAQAVLHQGAVGFGQAELEGRPACFMEPGWRAGAAVARDVEDVRAGLDTPTESAQAVPRPASR